MKFIPLILLLLIPSFASSSSIIQLPHLLIKPGSVTVSGVSSGAFMAVQLDVAASKMISGVGTIAGGIYGCASGTPLVATQLCMKNPSYINTSYFVGKAQLYSIWRTIDSNENLKSHKVYIFQSQADQIVQSDSANKLKDFYKSFVSAKNIKVDWHKSATHGFPSIYQNNKCDQIGLPWLLNCGVDIVKNIFTHLYGKLKPATKPINENLFIFSQKEYAAPFSNFLEEGHIYIPNECQNGSTPCKLHLALHGCTQSPEFVKNEFVNRAGYNHWAESNNIVILYPAVAKSILNPNGCWDWWGYTGMNYATKSGPQIKSLIKMINAISTE